FDPAETPETAARKKHAAIQRYKRPGSENGWHFLTGDEAAIRALTAAMGFRYTYDARSKQFAHASGILAVTPHGRISRYLYGVDYAPRDVRLALVEASQNKIGSAVDQFLLFCYHYDPSAGKYTTVALNILRLAGVITVLALAAFMFTAARKVRHT
ncbi:MAG: SCO family protein, partial [Bryobacteraceae bacterium]